MLASLAVEDALTRTLILIISLGYIFQAFDVLDYAFQASVQSKYSVVAKNAAFFLLSAAKVAALLLGAPLLVFAMLATAEIIVGSIALAIAYSLRGGRIDALRFDARTGRSLLADSWPLTLSGLAIVVYMRIDQVMLGAMAGAAGRWSVRRCRPYGGDVVFYSRGDHRLDFSIDRRSETE